MTANAQVQRVSIIIPVYNERDTIAEVIRRVRQVDLGSMEKEIIVSDDGSTDGTRDILEQLSREQPGWFTLDKSPINYGKGSAVRVGMSIATGEVVIIQDADLELDPNEYTRLLEPILQGKADVVYGSRFLKSTGRVPRKSLMANRFLTGFTNLLFRGRLTDMETAYKAFRRTVLQKLRLRCVGFDFEPEFTARVLSAGYRILEVPITYIPRTSGEGKKIRTVDGFDALITLLRCRFWR